LKQLGLALALIGALLSEARSVRAGPEQVVLLLSELTCIGCDLRHSDLVQASLQSANLRAADLEGANLSGADLDGADLSKADLSFTSLYGASLRGANLLDAKLHGTDLRRADLSGAKISAASLHNAYWSGAVGIDSSMLSYSELHNAGAEAAANKRWEQAEKWFSHSIQRNPEAAISWVARGIARIHNADMSSAAQDIAQASRLYRSIGDEQYSEQLMKIADSLIQEPRQQRGGNGVGIKALRGALSVLKILAPLAMKSLLPVGI